MKDWIVKVLFDMLETVMRFAMNVNPPKNIVTTKGVQYANGGRRLNRMDIHYPENCIQSLPVIVYFHGGGWTTGDKASYTRVCKVFASEGYVVCNVNYRLSPKHRHPSQIIDISNALTWIKENISQYHGDRNKIFFAGDSSGAHLASLSVCLATNETLQKRYNIPTPYLPEQIKGIMLFYGAYNFRTLLDTGFVSIDFMIGNYLGTKIPEQSEHIDWISPVDHITEKFPPAFISAGEVDKLYPQTIEFIAALERKGIPYTKVLFDKNRQDAIHAFINFYKNKAAQEVYALVADFLRTNR